MNPSTLDIYVKDLANLVTGDVSIKEVDIEKTARDTSLFYVRPIIVIYPKSGDDISAVVRYINEINKKGASFNITMRSAGTCMTGGPLSQSVVMDTSKYMNHITHVTKESATAESGVYYRNFEKETLKKGWLMPSYPASRELAAIGGIVSNNSGGEKTLVYGKTENYVKSLDVVFADGSRDTIHKLSRAELDKKMSEDTTSGRIHKEMYELIEKNYNLIMKAKPTVSKNSSGYYLWNVYDKENDTFDLNKLIVGSQGTLVCVSSATITGVKPKNHSRMMVMFLPTTSHLGEIIPALLKHKPETMESYDDNVFKIAVRFFGDIARRMGGSMFTLGFQFLPEFWMALSGGIPKIILMAEFAGDSEEEVKKQVDEAYEDMKRFDLPMKKMRDELEAKKYWTFRRESFSLLRNHLHGLRTAPTIDDIVVHPKDLPEFLPKLEKIFSKYTDLIYTVQGHMGDANFHIIPLVNIHKEGIITTLHKVMDEVYDLVLFYKGSISAEHNDGLLRTPYLSKMFDSEIIYLFEKTKSIFDPQGLLNPMKKVHGDKDFAWTHIDKK